MSVLLVIKSPTQHVEDFKLNCELTWTVGEVKEEISSLYPSNPKKEHQKLIYGGKLLPDHLSLKSVLNHTQEVHTMHLVCPASTKSETSRLSDASNKEAFSTPPFNPLYTEMNQNLLATNDLASNVPAHNVTPSIPVYPTTDVTYHYLALQQMYSQFMSQYLSQMNGYGAPGIPYGYPPPPNQPQMAPAAPAPDVNQNVIQNERPAAHADDDRERDYIDYLYVFSRSLMMFAILYYHSSLYRIMAVLVLCIFISVYVKVTRRYQIQMEELQQRANIQEDSSIQNTPVVDIQNAGSSEEQSSDNTESEMDEAHQQESSQQGQPFVTAVSTVLTIIQSFFASLIPYEPLPVNTN